MVTKDPMVTLGVDLASQPKKTGICLIRWDDGSAHVESLCKGASDDDLLELFERTGEDRIDKIGIDAPFGWPRCFTKAVAAYTQVKPWPPEDDEMDGERGPRPPLSELFPTTLFPHLRYRRTDEVVECAMRQVWKEKSRPDQRVKPLSVSSDRIAAPAMRTAGLFAQWAVNNGKLIDRSGSGCFVEVYPAAALARWGLRSTGYKGTTKEHQKRRKDLVLDLAHKSGLDLTAHEKQCKASDDVLDALVAALVTRAHHIDECEEILADDQQLAEEEGWIALPKPDSLKQLVMFHAK